MNKKPSFLAVLLIFGLFIFSCTKTSDSDVKKSEAKLEDMVSINNPLSINPKGLIKIKFEPDQLPEEYTSVEIIFNGKYQGYFNLANEILLPNRHEVVAIFSDSDGNKMGDRKTFYIEVPK